MNLTNSMIILFHNFFFQILYAALACCENWDKIMLFGCVIKNKPICLHIVLLAFYNTTCPCALVIPFSIISFRICPTAYIIDIKKVNISHLQCIEVGGNISLMTKKMCLSTVARFCLHRFIFLFLVHENTNGRWEFQSLCCQCTSL